MTPKQLVESCLHVGFVGVLAVGSSAQTTTITKTRPADEGRPFALVVNSSTLISNGDWQLLHSLGAYTQQHPGNYIVFSQGGTLHRLGTPERVAEAQRLYVPLIPLAAKQHALAEQQKPFAAEQRALAAEQRTATDAAEMGRIGALQGEVGRQQGAIGARQGEIGRRQGELGKALYDRVQGMLDACLSDGTCPSVPEQTASREPSPPLQ